MIFSNFRDCYYPPFYIDRMKRVCILITAICFATTIFAQAEPPKYTSATAKFKRLYNAGFPDSIFADFSPELKSQLPQETFSKTTIQLKEQLGPLVQTEFVTYNTPLASYKAVFKNGIFMLNLSLNSKYQFTGLLLTPYQEPGKPEAKAQIKLDPSLTESPVLLQTLSGTISGTLTTPKEISGKIPVVLIIAGSGPIDRDGNSAKLSLATNNYRMIAEALGKENIASLRYDKRMVGESAAGMKEDNLRFDDYVDDAIGLINLLKEDKRFSKIIVLGHSEGSLVGMLAAASTQESTNAFISVAGAGRRADIVLKEQMKSQPAYISEGFSKVLDSLAVGKLQKNVNSSLYFVARPSIQNYLMSWCKFDPEKEIRNVKVPVLITQGMNDLQVKTEDATNLKKSGFTLSLIPGMNHVLKEAPADRDKNMATYNQPDLPLKPEFMAAVLDFIKKLK
jgi:pimeloyl-ACP methyl ester carboxylesterase